MSMQFNTEQNTFVGYITADANGCAGKMLVLYLQVKPVHKNKWMKTLCTLVGNTNKYILFKQFNVTDTYYDPGERLFSWCAVLL